MIASNIKDSELEEADLDSITVRATLLLANASRLRRDYASAERHLDRAALIADTSSEAAFHLRILGILRWDQGRCQETVGLLYRSERAFRHRGDLVESDATNQLLMLLHAELGEKKDTLALISSLVPDRCPNRRPWLLARASYTAAFHLVSLDPQKARSAAALGRSLLPLVPHASERLHLDWLDARTRARLGEDGLEETLRDLARRFASPETILQSLLVTFDLYALGRSQGRNPKELLDSLEPPPSYTRYLQMLAHATETSTAALIWEDLVTAETVIRRALRRAQVPFPPLPFA